MTEVTSDLLRQKRDNFRVEIRRQQTEKILKQKRQKYTNTQVCQITDEIANDWYNRLVNNDLDVLPQIRAAVAGESAEKHEVYNKIVKIWIDCDLDPGLLHLLLHILANMHSYNVFDDLVLLKNKAVINKAIQLLLITNYQQIQQSIFFLLSNLVAVDNGSKARTLADYGFCSILRKMWCEKLIYLEADNLKEFTWFLNNFFYYKSSYIAGFTMSEVRDILPIVLELIYEETATKEIKMYCLTTLTHILQAKEEVLGILMKKENFIQGIQQLERNCKDEEIQLKYVEILCGFALADDPIPNQLIEWSILDYLLQIYIQPGRKNQKQFKKVILWGLCNFCCSQDFLTLKKIVQHDLIKYMQMDADSPDLIKDILEVIRALSILQDTDLLKFVLMNRSIADIIINQIKLKLSKNITILCLQIIDNFASRIGKYSQSDINMAIEVFNSKGFDQLLHQLEYDSDDDIVNYAFKINETFLQ